MAHLTKYIFRTKFFPTKNSSLPRESNEIKRKWINSTFASRLNPLKRQLLLHQQAGKIACLISLRLANFFIHFALWHQKKNKKKTPQVSQTSSSIATPTFSLGANELECSMGLQSMSLGAYNNKIWIGLQVNGVLCFLERELPQSWEVAVIICRRKRREEKSPHVEDATTPPKLSMLPRSLHTYRNSVTSIWWWCVLRVPVDRIFSANKLILLHTPLFHHAYHHQGWCVEEHRGWNLEGKIMDHDENIVALFPTWKKTAYWSGTLLVLTWWTTY